MFRKVGLSMALLALLAASAGARQEESGQQSAQSFEAKITKTISGRYLFYLPKKYGDEAEKEKKWPLLLFLHGAGERGDKIENVKQHGPPKLIAQGKEFPFIVVSPQCPENEWWSAEVLNGLLDTIIKKYRVDENRIYCTGLSMGGFGTWALAMEYPNRFAAIAPICGGGNARNIAGIKDIPAWAFPGATDSVVPLPAGQTVGDARKAAGGTVQI